MRTGQVIPLFKHTLIIIGRICDADCKFVFTEQSIVVYDMKQQPLITGQREPNGTNLWHISLLPLPSKITTPPIVTKGASLQEFSAYDIPRMEALVRYFHAAAGFPVRYTWLCAIKCGKYSSWTGLMYANADKYFSYSDETIMGHIVQSRQGVWSTKPKLVNIQTTTPTVGPPIEPSWELHIHIENMIKPYTDDTGRFPILPLSGNQCLMISYQYDYNVTLVSSFKLLKDSHRLLAYNKITTQLKQQNQIVDLQILDNEASADYKRTMWDIWKVDYQLSPPNLHLQNSSKRSIFTFKAYFLSTLAGIAEDSPQNMWDILISQTKMTLNLLWI